jgi:peptide/nickel transport system ATP-binding protein
MTELILEVRDLVVRSAAGTTLVDGISFDLDRRTRTGLIGESGSGKSLTALSIMGLLPEGLTAEGSVILNGRDMLTSPEKQLCTIRGNDVSMIFQEPMTALNPVMRIGQQIAEALRFHQAMSRSDAAERVVDLLTAVRIEEPELRARAFPHQLSGGMRQRAMIAMALACGPDLVIADEPTTALDVTIQAQVLDVLEEQVENFHTALLIITHDLPVVARSTSQVMVMNAGRIVEKGETRAVFSNPTNVDTQALVGSVPPLSRSATVDIERREDRDSTETVISVRNVTRVFPLPRSGFLDERRTITAVDEITLVVQKGETFGIVGESGSGKSTLARMMIALDIPTEGEIVVNGIDIAETSKHQPLRRQVQMIFQDPMGSLDPRFKVGRIIAEPLRSLKIEGDHRARVAELIDAVELPADSVVRYPHEFSGGQRQRIAIARALAPSPDILIADEPVSALDMSIQTITLDLLAHLKDEYGLTMVFISHDLSVVHEICDRVAVMQHGRLVEEGQVDEVFLNPRTDYTERLIAAIPRLDGT